MLIHNATLHVVERARVPTSPVATVQPLRGIAAAAMIPVMAMAWFGSFSTHESNLASTTPLSLGCALQGTALILGWCVPLVRALGWCVPLLRTVHKKPYGDNWGVVHPLCEIVSKTEQEGELDHEEPQHQVCSAHSINVAANVSTKDFDTVSTNGSDTAVDNMDTPHSNSCENCEIKNQDTTLHPSVTRFDMSLTRLEEKLLHATGTVKPTASLLVSIARLTDALEALEAAGEGHDDLFGTSFSEHKNHSERLQRLISVDFGDGGPPAGLLRARALLCSDAPVLSRRASAPVGKVGHYHRVGSW